MCSLLLYHQTTDSLQTGEPVNHILEIMITSSLSIFHSPSVIFRHTQLLTLQRQGLLIVKNNWPRAGMISERGSKYPH